LRLNLHIISLRIWIGRIDVFRTSFQIRILIKLLVNVKMMISETTQQPTLLDLLNAFPSPTVSQLEEALEERVLKDRRVSTDDSRKPLIERRVADRRGSGMAAQQEVAEKIAV